jgi:hypothetical protein
MELNLPRTPGDSTRSAARRWPAGPVTAVRAGAHTAAEWRYLIVIAAVIVLVALAGASPRI